MRVVSGLVYFGMQLISDIPTYAIALGTSENALPFSFMSSSYWE